MQYDADSGRLAHYSHQPYTPKQQFLAGVTDNYALDSAIINSFRSGIALDSTWRHVNNNGHPLTMVTTTNDAQRMNPGEYRHKHV